MKERNNLYIRSFSLVMILLIALVCFFKCTDGPKVYRIGVICDLKFFEDTFDGFKQKMNDLGYVEGKNVVYDIQYSNSNIQAAQKIISKFIDDKVDLIFAFPTEVALESKKLTRGTGINVVFANSNIEGVNLVNSIKEPGDNITGIRYPGPDLSIKRFEILREIIPSIKRIWIPYLKRIVIVPAQLEALKEVAEHAGITIIDTPINDEKELKQIISEFEKNKTANFDAVLGIAEPLLVTPNLFKIVAEYADNNKIPIGGALMRVGEYESIFGVSTDNVSVGMQAATLANKIFKGIKAGNIPVVSAENFIQINYKEIRKQGLNVPTGILKQANEIIQ